MNKAKFPELPFLSAKATAAELYAVSMDEDTFVEVAWYAYRDIGNIAIDNYVAKVEVDARGIVELPSNLDTIEAVTTTDIAFPSLDTGYQLYDSGIPVSKWFFTQTVLNETVRYYNLGQSSAIAPGELVGYDWVERFKIKINNENLRGQEVYVVYKGIVIDESCLPMVTFKESMAIAARAAYYKVQRDLFMGKPGAGDILAYIKTESGRLMQAAKIPEYITQNEMNSILDAQTSWERKTYGKSFKAFQGR